MLDTGRVFSDEGTSSAILHPDPIPRLTTKQALSYRWLMNFAASTGHNLCDLYKNFDPCAYWHNAVSAAQALSCFVKSSGMNNSKKDHLTLSSANEDDNRSRSGSLLWRTAPEPDYCVLQGGLAGLAKGTPKTMSPSLTSPMSSYDSVWVN